MNFAETLCLVLVAVYGLTSLLLSILVACSWRARVRADQGGEAINFQGTKIPCAAYARRVG
jgi:hypothetical protein